MKFDEAVLRNLQDLIDEGFEFDLHYGSSTYDNSGTLQWECDIVKKLPDNGGWDNFETGISLTDPNEAINQAVGNVRKGIRL